MAGGRKRRGGRCACAPRARATAICRCAGGPDRCGDQRGLLCLSPWLSLSAASLANGEFGSAPGRGGPGPRLRPLMYFARNSGSRSGRSPRSGRLPRSPRWPRDDRPVTRARDGPAAQTRSGRRSGRAEARQGWAPFAAVGALRHSASLGHGDAGDAVVLGWRAGFSGGAGRPQPPWRRRAPLALRRRLAASRRVARRGAPSRGVVGAGGAAHQNGRAATPR